jgi:hypothetical protein
MELTGCCVAEPSNTAPDIATDLLILVRHLIDPAGDEFPAAVTVVTDSTIIASMLPHGYIEVPC